MSTPLVPLGPPSAYALYDLVEAHILSTYPDVSVRHTKTQTAFARKVQFAWVTQPLHKADAGGIQFYLALPFLLDSPPRGALQLPQPGALHASVCSAQSCGF